MIDITQNWFDYYEIGLNGCTGGYTAHVEENRRTTAVLGPDGRPVVVEVQKKIGFDLSKRSEGND